MSIFDLLGKGDGSVGKEHTEQSHGSAFRFPCLCTKLDLGAHDGDLSSRKAETRDTWALIVFQLSQIGGL